MRLGHLKLVCVFFGKFCFAPFLVYGLAHSAYNFHEMAEALKAAFHGLQHVEALFKFTNFKDAVTGLLNVAAQTPGDLELLY